MKIAFISYEYPPDTAYGGSATYVQQAAVMLARRGHKVEVFAGSSSRQETYNDDGVLVHTLQGGRFDNFPGRAGAAFAARHRVVGFDVVEGIEYEATCLRCGAPRAGYSTGDQTAHTSCI